MNAATPTVCVCTPTYNRAHTLGRLYESLAAQTSDDFIWLVIDDGSTDDTERLVASFAREGRVRMAYVKTANGGKQRALNLGVSRCASELFFCVDSDDYLVNDAIGAVCAAWEGLRDHEEVAGIVAMRGSDAATPIGTAMPRDVPFSTLRDLYRRHGFAGDTSLIYRTAVLERYPFEVPEGETFISESTVYNLIDASYVLAVLPRILMVCTYLPDGYTAGFAQVTKANPKAYVITQLQHLGLSSGLREKLYHTTLLLVGRALVRRKYGCAASRAVTIPNRSAALVCALPAFVLLRTVFR